MSNNIEGNYINLNFYNIFKVGIFLLPSAPSISGIIFFISGLNAFFRRKSSYFSDKWNYPFLIFGFSLLISTIFLTQDVINYSFNTSGLNLVFDFLYKLNITKDEFLKLSWIGLFNWIPYILFFWSFQYYSFSYEQRKNISLILISGTVPVFITGLLQYFFQVNGPFILFNGIITWFAKPIDGYNGLSGLFSNANYTGTWLNIIWPFALVFFIEKNKPRFQKYVSIIFLFLIIATTLLTMSRNAYLGLFIGLILIYGPKFTKKLIAPLTVVFTPIILSIGIVKNDFLINLSRKIVPSIIWKYKFAEYGLGNLSNYGRIEIWGYALKFISERPLLGWGSASFPFLYEIETLKYKGHTHNLFLEIALSYGIVSLSIFLFAITLVIWFSYKKNIQIEEIYPNYDSAWRTSFILILVSQMFDIQYFDFRIGFMFWFLLGGLRNFIK